MTDSPKSVFALAFVSDLPKTKGQDRRRCFWNVKASGVYSTDCMTGSRLALEYLEHEASTGQSGGPILGAIVGDMPSEFTGLEIGFFSVIDIAAVEGVSEARRVVAYWIECEAKQGRTS